MQNYKKISTFASIMKVNIEKRLSAYHFIALLRHYPLSCCLIIGIWIACFMNVPDTPLSHVTLIDKWTHFTMYGCLCLVIGLEIQKRWTVATTEAAACLHVATAHTDEWPYRAIASLLHGWTSQWRMARLYGQRYRCYDRHHYRYSVGKVSRQRQKGFVSKCEL